MRPEIIISNNERRMTRMMTTPVFASTSFSPTISLVVEVLGEVVLVVLGVVVVVVGVVVVVVVVVVGMHSGLMKSPRSLLQLMRTEDPSL